MNNRNSLIGLLMAVALASSLFTLWITGSLGDIRFPWQAEKGFASQDVQQEAMDKFWSTYRLIREGYLNEVDEATLLEGAIRGMVESLGDPHSTYLDPEAARQFQSNMDASFEGIGAHVKMENNRIVIESPIKGSPAEKAGLRVNDQILSVDGESLEGLDIHEAVAKIRGPKGTKVVLTIARPGMDETFTVTVVRDEIPLVTVYSQKLGNFGWITIAQFATDTAKEFKEKLEELLQSGIQGLVIDVRGNPGGRLDTVVDIADQILPEGQGIVQVQYRSGEPDKTMAKGDGLPLPIVVLVDEGSASASEILAGALQDAGYPVVGATTYGKGTVQNTFPVSDDGSEVKVTVAKWLTPAGRWIHETGIQPDYEVQKRPYFMALAVDGSKGLRQNMNSLEVKNLQMVLEGVGYPPGRSDGYFDQRTREAVMAFQRQQNLPATGVVDEATAQRLNQVLLERLQDPQNDTQLQAALKLLEKQASQAGK